MDPIRSAGRSVVRRALLPLLVAAGTAALVAVDIRILAENSPRLGRSAYVGPKAAPLPTDWSVYVEHGLILATPPGWPRAECLACPSPDGVWLALSRPTGQSMTIRTRPGYEAKTLAQSRFIAGTGSQVKTLTSTAPGVVVGLSTCCASWQDAGEAGQYESRILFVQLATDLAGDVAAAGRRIAGASSAVSAQDAALQDAIASHVALARDTDGVFTAVEVEGILRSVGLRLTEVSANTEQGARSVVWSTDRQTTVSVAVYPDARSRRVHDPNLATTKRSAAVSARGVGNLLVTASGGDAETRYMVIRSLDQLFPEPFRCTRGAFARLDCR